MVKNVKTTDKVMETDVLVLGSGAAGCGAAIAAREKGARVIVLDKGKAESSGSLGGGNDHFMAVLHSGDKNDTTETLVNFFKGPMSGYTEKQIEEAWAKCMPPCLKILEEVGVEFVKQEDGSWLRSVGFGQPGAWWIHISNGGVIKRLIAKKVRDMGIEVLDHFMATRLLKRDNKIVGCVGYNVLDGTFYSIRAKKVVLALGNVAARGWVSSTWNPYNCWFSPYNTGSQFVLPYEAGVKLLNVDTQQLATLLPKGYGAPGMNGINNMGGRELNALGERFMGKYDPMWENGFRINQMGGTYQEMVEGKGPPFYMDMTHFKKEDAWHLQNVLMPADKATYLDYCRQKGIDFTKAPLEVEISELSFGGVVYSQDTMETNVSGLYNGCAFMGFSGAMCSGYYAGGQAAEAAKKSQGLPDLDQKEIQSEKERIFAPMKIDKGVGYKEVEKSISQVLNYYVGYRRTMKGMEVALEKLALIEEYARKIKAPRYRDLMRAHETMEVLKIARLTVLASMQRKESGRAYYRIAEYPNLNPQLNKVLVAWQENGQPKFSWGI